MNLGIGLTHSIQCIVEPDMTADNVGSGSLAVFSTPSLLALMEATAFELAEKGMDDGYTTVGSRVDLHHMSPTPVGIMVKAEAKLTKILDNRLTFKIVVYDKSGAIGEATHIRYIVDRKRFMRAADKKL
ncbi:MAG: thioesterase family protein [Eubacteriales bacterium]